MKTILLLIVGVLSLGACGTRTSNPAVIADRGLDVARIDGSNFYSEFSNHLDTLSGHKKLEEIVGQFAQARFGIQSWSLSAGVAELPSAQLTLEYNHRVRGEVILAGASKDTWRETILGDGLVIGLSQAEFPLFALPTKIDLTKKGLAVSSWALLHAQMQSKKMESLILVSLDDKKTIAEQIMGVVNDTNLRKTEKNFPFYFSESKEQSISIGFTVPKEGELGLRLMRLERGAANGKDVVVFQKFRLIGI